VNVICLAPVGDVDTAVLEVGRRAIRVVLYADPLDLAPLPAPDYAWDEQRGQYNSSLVLRDLLPRRPGEAIKICGLTEKDLFIPMLSFVYGQAQVGGEAALVSLARLRQEFYGLPANPDLLAERAGKEILHEIGHTFGLVHCQDVHCVMSLCTNLRQLDVKGGGFCSGCRALLMEQMPGEERLK
jgi:archaemetzincin